MIVILLALLFCSYTYFNLTDGHSLTISILKSLLYVGATILGAFVAFKLFAQE